MVDKLLVGGVQRAGRLVENEQRRVADQRAGDLEPLPLPAAEIHAALRDRRRIAERPGEDFVVNDGILRRGDDLFVGNRGVPQG